MPRFMKFQPGDTVSILEPAVGAGGYGEVVSCNTTLRIPGCEQIYRVKHPSGLTYDYACALLKLAEDGATSGPNEEV